MDWLTKMNAAIDYIESNLTNEIDYSIVAMHKKFYTEWLPTAKYERADRANFEIYGGTEEVGYIELWFPIISK